MGVDDPKTFISSMNGSVMPQTKTSGGDLSPLPTSTVVKQPMDLSGLTHAMSNLSKQIIGNISKQRKEQEDMQRGVEYARLTTQTVMDTSQAFDQYKAGYSGDPMQFTEGYLKDFDQYTSSKTAGIRDAKLAAMYQEFAYNQRAKTQLAGLQHQQALDINNYNTSVRNQVQTLDDLVRQNPTPETLSFANMALQAIYSPMQQRLKQYGKGEEAATDLRNHMANLSKVMILRQAGIDPLQAQETIKDPEVNQWIDPEDQITVENQIETIKNRKFEPLKAQAKLAVGSYVEGLAIGNDVSGLRQTLSELAAYGSEVLTPAQQQQIIVAEKMSAPFAQLRNNMVAMSEEELEDALRELNPKTNPNTVAGIDLKDQEEFYNSAANALWAQYKGMKDNPISTMAGITGESNPEAATMQFVHARMRAGDNWQDIKVLDKKTADQYLNALNNAATAGQTDAVVQLMNELRERYGADPAHPYRQIAPGVDTLDLALTQLSKSSNHPISRRLIAAYHLLPKDQPIDSHNNLLIRAAMMNGAQRNQLVRDTGLLEFSGGNLTTAMNALDAKLSKDSKLWRNYFNPASPTPQGAALLQNQKSLLLDTMLLNMSAGYRDDKLIDIGPIQLGNPFGASGKQKAVDSIIQQYLPFTAISVSGNPVKLENGGFRTPSVAGLQFNVLERNFNVNFNTSDLLIHKDYEETVKPDMITQYVGDKLQSRDWIFQNLRLPGINDNVQPVNKSWGKSQAFNDKVGTIAQRVGADSNDLMAVMSIESGLNPKAMNKTSTATGLIQWMKTPDGSSREQFAAMDELKQLDFVGQWFGRHKGKLTSPGRVYLAVAAPGVLSSLPANAGPETVVYKAGSAAAKANPLWQDKNGNVTLGKLDSLVRGRKKQMGVSDTPSNYAAIKPGQQALLDQAMKLTNQNLTLKNTEDLRGVRVYTTVNGRPVPLVKADGKWLEFDFDTIARTRYQIGKQ